MEELTSRKESHALNSPSAWTRQLLSVSQRLQPNLLVFAFHWLISPMHRTAFLVALRLAFAGLKRNIKWPNFIIACSKIIVKDDEPFKMTARHFAWCVLAASMRLVLFSGRRASWPLQANNCSYFITEFLYIFITLHVTFSRYSYLNRRPIY